jgi:O-antigen ligase
LATLCTAILGALLGFLWLLVGFVLAHRQQSMSVPLLKLSIFWLLVLVVALIPIHDLLLNMLSPYRFELLQWVRPFVPDATTTLTLRVFPTLQSLSLMLIYVGYFLAASWIFENEDHRYGFARGVIIVGSFFALLGLLQRIVGVGWLPHGISGAGSSFSTFMNRNHAVILLVLVIPLTLSAFLSATTVKKRCWFGAAFLVQVLSCLFSHSRFAIVGIGISTAMTLGLHFLNHFFGIKGKLSSAEKKNKPLIDVQTVLATLALLGIVCFYAFVVMGTSDLNGQVERLSLKNLFSGYRLDLWRDSLTAWRHAPLFGFGAGNFEPVIPLFRTYQGFLRAEHAESEYLEVLVTTGCLGLALLLWAGFTIVRRIRKIGVRNDWLHTGVVAALLCLLAAMSVHFFFEVPAIMLLIAAILGMLFPLHDAKVILEPKSWQRRVFIGLLLILALANCGWRTYALISPAPPLRVNKAVAQSTIDVQAEALLDLDDAFTCIRNNPYEALCYQRYGWDLLLSGIRGSEPLKYLSMAIRLNPFDPATHAALAQVYLKNGELQLAVQSFKKTIELTSQVYTPALKNIYLQLAQLQLQLNESDQAESSLQSYMATGGGAARAELIRMVHELNVGQFRQAVSIAERALAHDDQYLEPILRSFMQQQNLSPLDLRAGINQVLLAANDLLEAMQRAEKIIPAEIKQRTWGGKLFVYLPGRFVEDYNSVLQRVDSRSDQPVPQQSRYDNQLQDWVYSLEAHYPNTREYLDLWGAQTNLTLSGAKHLAHLQMELMVKAPYKPMKQLYALAEPTSKNAALGKTVESLRLLNQEIVSMPEGWYSLRLRLDGADNSLFKNEAITLRYIAFNTAMVSGRYQISSFRIYLGN